MRTSTVKKKVRFSDLLQHSYIYLHIIWRYITKISGKTSLGWTEILSIKETQRNTETTSNLHESFWARYVVGTVAHVSVDEVPSEPLTPKDR